MAKRKPKSRSPIVSGEPWRNDNASISFSASIMRAVWQVRQEIAILARRDEVNENAPGSIHGLRKLCEGEAPSGHIHASEVAEWRDAAMTWLDRVQDEIPPALLPRYRASLEDDFQVILAAAGGSPVLFSRREANMRYLPIPFESDEDLQAARQAAERKHPVRLGSALHEYLKECVRRLVADP